MSDSFEYDASDYEKLISLLFREMHQQGRIYSDLQSELAVIEEFSERYKLKSCLQILLKKVRGV